MKTTKADNSLTIETIQLKKAAMVFRAINHPLRQEILHLLHGHQQMMVTEIYRKLRLEQSVASQHLGILRNAGFVNTHKDGKKVFYSVNYARLDYVTTKANALISTD